MPSKKIKYLYAKNNELPKLVNAVNELMAEDPHWSLVMVEQDTMGFNYAWLEYSAE